jgi:hypothetical protein
MGCPYIRLSPQRQRRRQFRTNVVLAATDSAD